MNLSLYSAATGMEAQQLNLNTIANNIANVSTTGFKRNKIEFQDLLYQTDRPAGGDAGGGAVVPTSVETGNGTRVASTSKVFSQGDLTETGERFDVAIQGDGFFQLDNTDGNPVYSRDGSMKVGPNGELMNADGLLFTGLGQVPVGTVGVSITANGQITFQNADGTSQQGPQIQLVRFINPAGMKAIGSNLFIETAASGTPETGNPAENGFGSLRQGYLELSNVSVVQEMVNMIVSQRAYEINSKAIQTSDTMLGTVNQLKRS